MDFYLHVKHFLTDLAVNAKSCLNSNYRAAVALPDNDSPMYQILFNCLIVRFRQDAMLTVKPHTPVHKNMTAMPLPAPYPVTFPSATAIAFPDRIKGSNT